MTDQADETIVLRYIIDAKEVLEKSKQIREQINALKAEMKKMAADGKASYADIAKGMIEVSKVRMTENVAALRAEIQSLNEEHKKNAGVFHAQAQQNLADIEAKKAAINSERQAHQQYSTSVKTGLQEINRENKQLESSMKAAGGAAGGLKSNLLGLVGAVTGITSLVMIFQKLLGYLKEAAQAGKEFAQGTFSMVVGVRALQRAGVEITIADVTEQLRNLKKEFGVFVTKDLVVGSAAFLNLNRDMGFTKEQLFELQDAIATLAVVNGRSMDEVQKTVALALSSGYTEGLQRLGVSINRVTIAQEAARLGWEGGYTALNEQQRALATYNLVIRKTNIYLEDLKEYQKSLPGQFDVATAAIADQKNALGKELLPVLVELAQAWAKVTEESAKWAQSRYGEEQYIERYVQELTERRGGDIDLERLAEARRAAAREWTALMEKQSTEGFKSTEEIIAERFGATLGDVEIAQAELGEAVGAIIEEQLDEINSVQEEFQEDSKDAWEDYQRDLEELEIEHGRRLEDIVLDYTRRIREIELEHQRRMDDLALENSRRLDDINADYERALEDLALDEANDAANVWADYYNKLASAEANYRNKQIDAEVKYQETLLRLREGFLLDLEDALQVRDARQVLKLIRRYNLEKEQADRAFDQEMDRLRREHEERLAELARQRDERLRQIAEEMAAKRAMLELEHRRKLEDEQRRFEREQADEEVRFQQERRDEWRRYRQRLTDEWTRYQQEKADRDTRYAQELIDLEAHLQERYDIIAAALLEEVGYTDEQMEALRVALNDTLGPGGEADAIYGYYIQRALSAAAAAATALAYMAAVDDFALRHSGDPFFNPSTNVPGGGGGGSIEPALGMAEGGIAVADKPTNVTFGEAGTELAAFVPLKDIASIPDALSSIGNGLGGNSAGAGNVKIELWLDRYLEGRIVDSAVDNVADVILRRFRQ